MPLSARASWMGVTVTAPWPMPTEMTSPAYHFSCWVLSFQAVEGMVPVTSSGRSMPVFWREADRGGVLRDGVDAEAVRRGCSRRCRRSTGWRCRCRPCRGACRRRRSGRRRCRRRCSTTCMVWATFSCRPASDMMILKVRAGASWAWMVLLSSGWSGLLRISFQ